MNPAVAIILTLALWAGVSHWIGSTPVDPVATEYCPMWEVWHDQKRAGVPVEIRNGWPDPAGRYFEECEQ